MPKTGDDTRYFYSYKSLFRINFKIYDVGGKVLPRALPLDALFLAVILYFPLLPLGWLLKPSHPWLAAWLLSGVTAWLLS
ncbi:MAG: TcpE family conjugal transfer membrane protein [Bacillota bacterium]